MRDINKILLFVLLLVVVEYPLIIGDIGGQVYLASVFT